MAYTLIFSDKSLVEIEYSMNRYQRIISGAQLHLKAKNKILGCTRIYSILGTVALDAKTHHTGLSTIFVAKKGGITTAHILAGPIRLLNSDCNPNAKVCVLSSTELF